VGSQIAAPKDDSGVRRPAAKEGGELIEVEMQYKQICSLCSRKLEVTPVFTLMPSGKEQNHETLAGDLG
jgi:hypothetical protein